MHIEKNTETRSCTIWVNKDEKNDYRDSEDYQKAVEESKARGYSLCIYLGGELPLLPIIDEMIKPNPLLS